MNRFIAKVNLSTPELKELVNPLRILLDSGNPWGARPTTESLGCLSRTKWHRLLGLGPWTTVLATDGDVNPYRLFLIEKPSWQRWSAQ